jgi:hypothetical protein
MATVVNKKPGLGAYFGQGFAGGVEAEGKEQSDLKKVMAVEAMKEHFKTQHESMLMNYLFPPGKQQMQSGNDVGATTNTTPQAQETGTYKQQFSPQQISAVSLVEPNVARVLQTQEHQNQQMDFQERKLKTSREDKKDAESLPFRQELASKALAASKGIENKENMLEIINKKGLDDPTLATLLTNMPFKLGERFLSPDTAQYMSALVGEYGDLKNTFVGQTRTAEINIYEKKLADLYLTDEQKKMMLTSRINALQTDIIRANTASEVENEGKHLGALAFQQEVERRTKDKVKVQENRLIDELNSQVDLAEKRKKYGPLDYADPQDKQIIDQAKREAGNDRAKTEKLLLSKGYTF